jgi:hypothetical protein
LAVVNKTHFVAAQAQDIAHRPLTLRAGAGVPDFSAMDIIVDDAVQDLEWKPLRAVVTRYLQCVKGGTVPGILMRQFPGQRRVFRMEAGNGIGRYRRVFTTRKKRCG